MSTFFYSPCFVRTAGLIIPVGIGGGSLAFRQPGRGLSSSGINSVPWSKKIEYTAIRMVPSTTCLVFLFAHSCFGGGGVVFGVVGEGVGGGGGGGLGGGGAQPFATSTRIRSVANFTQIFVGNSHLLEMDRAKLVYQKSIFRTITRKSVQWLRIPVWLLALPCPIKLTCINEC